MGNGTFRGQFAVSGGSRVGHGNIQDLVGGREFNLEVTIHTAVGRRGEEERGLGNDNGREAALEELDQDVLDRAVALGKETLASMTIGKMERFSRDDLGTTGAMGRNSRVVLERGQE